MIGEESLKQLDLKYHTHDGNDSPRISARSTIGIDQKYILSASEDFVIGSDAEVSGTTEAYQKVKEILIRDLPGIIRVKYSFRHITSPTGHTVKANIYLNGVAVGTEREATDDTWTEYSEDITLDESKSHNYIQIYVDSNVYQNEYGYVKNFRIYYIKNKIDNPRVTLN